MSAGDRLQMSPSSFSQLDVKNRRRRKKHFFIERREIVHSHDESLTLKTRDRWSCCRVLIALTIGRGRFKNFPVLKEEAVSPIPVVTDQRIFFDETTNFGMDCV